MNYMMIFNYVRNESSPHVERKWHKIMCNAHTLEANIINIIRI